MIQETLGKEIESCTMLSRLRQGNKAMYVHEIILKGRTMLSAPSRLLFVLSKSDLNAATKHRGIEFIYYSGHCY